VKAMKTKTNSLQGVGLFQSRAQELSSHPEANAQQSGIANVERCLTVITRKLVWMSKYRTGV